MLRNDYTKFKHLSLTCWFLTLLNLDLSIFSQTLRGLQIWPFSLLSLRTVLEVGDCYWISQ